MAYSAQTVFPAEVWADTRTDSPRSMHAHAALWKPSSRNGNLRAGR